MNKTYLRGVGLANVVDGDTVNPAVLTAPGSEVAHVLHDLLQISFPFLGDDAWHH